MIDPLHPEVAILNAALELPAGPRAAYLDEACAGDAALRDRVQALLRAHEQAEGFLEAPPTALDFKRATLLNIPLTERPGDEIGRYKLLQQIGEGGCGVVYMAEQEEPVRRRVALKVIKLGMDTKQVIARFEAERQALALMDHPNIAKVLDAGSTERPVVAGVPPAAESGVPPGGQGQSSANAAGDSTAGPGGKMPPSTPGMTPAPTLSAGRPYFVMELVRGIKITDFCDENRLSTEERLKLFIQVCQAIQHAHQKGIIHRDIKPSNIVVTINDGVPVPKVIDFGIAKATEGRLTDQTLFTAFEQFVGTPAYMSPEQAVMTSLDIDTRSDIYSLGVLLYELLTGRTPFDAKELLVAGLDEMRRTIREEEPLKPSKVVERRSELRVP
jgi:serine/threonine protein kinase